MKTLVFFLEEPSAKEFLKGLLPKFISDEIALDYKIFEGKQDLHKNLKHILRGWRKSDRLFLILRDQDSNDCIQIKNEITEIANEVTRYPFIVRIACRELESFYLGDLNAVEQGLTISGLSKKQNQAKFRNPDAISNPSKELSSMTSDLYQKIAGSRAISPHMSLTSNKSNSFRTLISGIRTLIDQC